MRIHGAHPPTQPAAALRTAVIMGVVPAAGAPEGLGVDEGSSCQAGERRGGVVWEVSLSLRGVSALSARRRPLPCPLLLAFSHSHILTQPCVQKQSDSSPPTQSGLPFPPGRLARITSSASRCDRSLAGRRFC